MVRENTHQSRAFQSGRHHVHRCSVEIHEEVYTPQCKVHVVILSSMRTLWRHMWHWLHRFNRQYSRVQLFLELGRLAKKSKCPQVPKKSTSSSTFKFQLRNGEDLGYSTDCQPAFFCTNRRVVPPILYWNHFVIDSFQIMHFHFVVVYVELVEASNIKFH